MGTTEHLKKSRAILKNFKVDYADSLTSKYWTKKWIHKGFCSVLQEQIISNHATIYIESGTCAGWSALWATLALPENGLTFTCDPNNVQKIWEHPILWEEWQHDVIPKIFYSQSRFHESIHRIAPIIKDKRKVIFIDGKHTEDAVKKDWTAVKDYLIPGDIVLFDDYVKNRRVRHAIDIIIRIPGSRLGRSWRYEHVG